LKGGGNPALLIGGWVMAPGERAQKRKNMFIQTEMTPNPATLKFLPGRTVLEEGTREFLTSDDAEGVSPLAARLFEVEGVTAVFLGSDFVSVTKDRGDWESLKPPVLGVIMEHFMSGQPVLSDERHVAEDEDFDEADKEVVTTIKELIETRVRPAVANDGGDITFKGFRDGVVYLKMQGACSGCPSATATLRHGIENLLKHFVPEVQEVQPV
jgi:Fe-S cluster biogenesis protein NfuA